MNRIITNKSKSNSKEREKDDSINSNNKSYKKIESKAIENMQRNLFFKGNKERQRILKDRQCSSLILNIPYIFNKTFFFIFFQIIKTNPIKTI